MTFNAYQQDMMRTYKPKGMGEEGHLLGLCGEVGEVAELVKKANYHGVPFTKEELEKELGDVLWYLTAVATDYNISLSEIAAANIAKLKSRYPDGFVKGGGNRDDNHTTASRGQGYTHTKVEAFEEATCVRYSEDAGRREQGGNGENKGGGRGSLCGC